MAEAQQLRQEQQLGNSVGLVVENKLRELLDSQEIRNLKDNTSYRELIVRKISLLFQNIFNAEKQKVTKQFEEQYAILEEYCERLQQERMDLTFHQDKLQNRSENNENMKNPLNQISNGTFTEENFEDKQDQSMLMLELQRIQKYCSQLEGMLEEANQSATSCYSKNVALQQLSEDLNEQIKYLQYALHNMERKLSTERDDNKQFVLSTVAQYKGKIRSQKQVIEENQQNLQFQKEQLHKFQLQENEEKNKYQKQIQQIEAQIEQVAQHYEAIIVNMKEKNKDDLQKIEAQFQKNVQYKELEDKQMTIEMETRIRREVHGSQDKIINELKRELERISKENDIKIKDLEATIRRNESIIDERNEDQRQIAGKLEKSMKKVEDYEKEIERLREENKQMENLMEKQKISYKSLQEDYENAKRKECDNRVLMMNKETSSAQNQLNKVLDEKIRVIEGLQSSLEEKDRKERIAVEKVHQMEIVLLKMIKENEELKQRLKHKQDLMRNHKEMVKIKLSRVLTDIAETKNRLTLAENKLIEKVSNLQDWVMHSIKAVQAFQNSSNTSGNQEILERLADSEKECTHQEQIIMKLKDMLQEAAETREECCVLRVKVSELQQEIREKRSWEENERGMLLKEKDKYTRENERLVCQNAVLRAEVAKLSVQAQRLAEENTRCNYDLQLKKEKTKLKSRKDTQNIAEIHQIIQHSVQTLHNNHAHTLKNLRQNGNNTKNMHGITPNNSVPFHQSISHTPSSPARTPLADTLNTSHINSINQQHQQNHDFTPSNSLSTSQVYSYHIPYSSSRSSTPVQNSTYIKQSIQSSRSPIRIANYDNLNNNYESFSKTLHKKQNQNIYSQSNYPGNNGETEVTSLKIRNDHENIIQNLSKLQQLDQFLQRSQSNSNIPSQQQQYQQTHNNALNQQQKQLQLSNPMMIQITSSFGPLSERTNGMLLNTSSQVSPLSQTSPAQLRRSQSFHIFSKPHQ